MNYEQKYKEALERAKKEWIENIDNCYTNYRERLEIIFPELAESEDERIRQELIEHIKANYEADYVLFKKFSHDDVIAWLEKQGGEQKQAWEPNAAQLIVIKDLIEDKNTSKVNKVILRGMFDEFKQFTNTNKREIDDAYLQGICDAKHEIEKQGEQPTDKIEPKFKVGDWIVQAKIGVYKVIEICESWYEVVDNKDKHYSIGFDKEYMCHLWTIEDAKDGDVLVSEDKSKIFLYNGKLDLRGRTCAYCGIYKTYDGLRFTKVAIGNYFTYKKFYPATKEQRDLLFQKMKDAGYEWDAEKKCLTKI